MMTTTLITLFLLIGLNETVEPESLLTNDSTQICINKTIQKETARFNRLYMDYQNKIGTKGYIKFRMVVMPTGNVENVSIDTTTIDNLEFNRILFNYVKRWKFQPNCATIPIEIVYPFIFK